MANPQAAEILTATTVLDSGRHEVASEIAHTVVADLRAANCELGIYLEMASHLLSVVISTCHGAGKTPEEIESLKDYVGHRAEELLQ